MPMLLIFLHLFGPVARAVFHPVGSNVTSVAEDEVMRILVLIRNYLPARDQVMKGDWDVPAVAVESWDLMDKTVGTVGGGRIGYHMMKRLRVSAAPMLITKATNLRTICIPRVNFARVCSPVAAHKPGSANMHRLCCLLRHHYDTLQQILEHACTHG